MEIKVGEIADKLEELVGFYPSDKEFLTSQVVRLELAGEPVKKMLEWKAKRLQQKEHKILRRELEVIFDHFKAGNEMIESRKDTWQQFARYRNADVAFLVSIIRSLEERLSMAMELHKQCSSDLNQWLEITQKLLDGRSSGNTE